MSESAVLKAAKPRLSVKLQALAALTAVVCGIALPQAVHLIGRALGVNSALGEVLLPMHLPVIAAGLLAGPFAGLAAGALTPLISFALTGMPSAAVLPFIIIELLGYGLASGFLRRAEIPVIAKVLAVQVIGRVLRAAAVLLSFYAFNFDVIKPASILITLKAGLLGIVLQWALVPAILYIAERIKSYDR